MSHDPDWDCKLFNCRLSSSAGGHREAKLIFGVNRAKSLSLTLAWLLNLADQSQLGKMQAKKRNKIGRGNLLKS